MKRSQLIMSVILIIALLLSASPALAEGGKRRITKVKAEIVSIDEATGIWQIGEMQVLVTESTMVVEDEGAAEVGAIVQLVFSQSGDEPHEAILIRVMSAADEETVLTIRGLITVYQDDAIVVNGMLIEIVPETRIVGELYVDALVKVEVRVGGESNVAVSIQELRVQQVEREVSFQGPVEAIEGDIWTIGEQQVLVNEDTVLIGEPGLGDLVSVQALVMEDGSLVATKIVKKDADAEPREIIFEGIIQRFPVDGIGLWEIGGRKVFVSEETAIAGEPQLGAIATVLAQYRGEGRLDALEITIENTEPTGTISGSIVRMTGGVLGRWLVGEWKVVVGPETVIEGDQPAVGAWAEVDVEKQGRTGTLVALHIQVTAAQDVETPEPSVTPEPTIPADPDPDPNPNPDPQPSATADPNPDPDPDPSPEPSRTRKTPKPSKTPKRGKSTPDAPVAPAETPEPDVTAPEDQTVLRRSDI